MKKLVLILSLFFVTSLSFASDQEMDNMDLDCIDYAIKSANAEEDHYGEMSDLAWLESAIWYYDACDEAGGNIEDPVFIG